MGMRTYITIRCPHCNKVVESYIERGTSKYINIGTPIDVCPHCKMPYRRKNINEWIFLSQKDREEYLKFGEGGSDRFGMFATLIVSAIALVVAIASSANNNHYLWIFFGICFAISLFLFVIPHIVKSNRNKDKKYNQIIIDSFERCCDRKYLIVLKTAGFKLQSINFYELDRNNLKEKYDAIVKIWNDIETNNSDMFIKNEKDKNTFIP